MGLSHYFDFIKESLPFYPYSAIAIVFLLLGIAALVIGRRRPSSQEPGQITSRPYTGGHAVGWSSHEEFDGGFAPVSPPSVSATMPDAMPKLEAMPLLAMPPLAMPPFVVPPLAAPPAAKPEPEAMPPLAAPPAAKPEPKAVPPLAVPPLAAPPTAAAPAETYKPALHPKFEQALKLCQGKFQGVYMDMYIELELLSNFDRVRTEVARRLREDDETIRAVSVLGMEPEAIIFMQIANVAGNILQNGERHTGKGKLDIYGEELLKVYRYALNAMWEKGAAGQEEVQNKLDFMEKRVQELGG